MPARRDTLDRGLLWCWGLQRPFLLPHLTGKKGINLIFALWRYLPHIILRLFIWRDTTILLHSAGACIVCGCGQGRILKLVRLLFVITDAAFDILVNIIGVNP